MTKKCTHCDRELDLSCFHIRRERPQCRRSWCRDCIKEAKNRWKIANLDKVRASNKRCNPKARDLSRFGGMYKVALARDNYTCTVCGMTQVEHLARWEIALAVHHIDGKGRRSKNPNNQLSNLQTVCLSCHCKIHTPRKKIKQGENQCHC